MSHETAGRSLARRALSGALWLGVLNTGGSLLVLGGMGHPHDPQDEGPEEGQDGGGEQEPGRFTAHGRIVAISTLTPRESIPNVKIREERAGPPRAARSPTCRGPPAAG